MNAGRDDNTQNSHKDNKDTTINVDINNNHKEYHVRSLTTIYTKSKI